MASRWKQILWRRKWRILLLILAIPPAILLGMAASIALYSTRSSQRVSDAAIVLGAAVWTDEPSPVFRKRIDHAVSLYRRGRVRKLLLTGGRAEGDTLSEAAAAGKYARKQGVPAEDILLETSSTGTWDNLRFAVPIAEEQNLRTFLVVSDPLHMRRAMRMADDLGLDARSSPTPTTLYRSVSSQSEFLAREVYYNLAYLGGRLVGLR